MAFLGFGAICVEANGFDGLDMYTIISRRFRTVLARRHGARGGALSHMPTLRADE